MDASSRSAAALSDGGGVAVLIDVGGDDSAIPPTGQMAPIATSTASRQIHSLRHRWGKVTTGREHGERCGYNRDGAGEINRYDKPFGRQQARIKVWTMALGPVMLGLDGLELSAEEREMLCHPRVGGVILFARNYRSPEQVAALTAAIHALRQPRLLVAVITRVAGSNDSATVLPACRQCVGWARFTTETGCAPNNWRRSPAGSYCRARAVGVDLSSRRLLDLDPRHQRRDR